MTWFPCTSCGCVPCACSSSCPRYFPATFTMPGASFGAPPKLTDEDIERIARRVAELLGAQPVPVMGRVPLVVNGPKERARKAKR